MASTSDLSRAEARAIAVAAQGLHRTENERDAAAVLDRLACIQLDSIAVVRRSHELVLLARGVPDEQARVFLDRDEHFEYWAHAAGTLPLRLWPYFAFRRRRYRDGGWRGPEVDPAACDAVRDAVAERGRVTISDLGGVRGSGWERTAPAKWAAEWLLATGELVCLSRRRFSRVYQSPPAGLRRDATDDECLTHLVRVALDALGVATSDDIADYFRLPHPQVREHLMRNHSAPIRVEGWREPAWLGKVVDAPIDPDACTPLSPFDSLVWHRPRARRLFGIDYVLEAYKPAARRQCGYFGMPVLAGTEIIGRVALRTERGTARIEGRQLVEGHDADQLRSAARRAAHWANTILAGPSGEGRTRGAPVR